MEKKDHPQTVQKALLVSRYATPLAILLVVLGIIVSNPMGWARDISFSCSASGYSSTWRRAGG